MKIYDEAKIQELNYEGLDFSKGYLKNDTVTVAHHEATPCVPGKTAAELYEELKTNGADVQIKYYKVLKKYDNGSFTVEEIKDEPTVPAKDECDEMEDVQVYVPYTEQELATREIAELKARLSETDFKAVEFSAGEITEEEFAPYKEQRRTWRERINELEKVLKEGAVE